MPIVENFLCFDLSIGGYAIGSFELFLQAVLIFFTGYQLTHSLAHATGEFFRRNWSKRFSHKLFRLSVELIMLIGEISIYSLSILTAVFLIAGTSRVRIFLIKNSKSKSFFDILARRSDDFSVPGDNSLSTDCNHRQSGHPSLAICSVCNLHYLLLRLHSIVVSTDPRGKSEKNCQQLSANAYARVKNGVRLKITSRSWPWEPKWSRKSQQLRVILLDYSF